MDAIVDFQRFGFPEAVSTTPFKINDHGDIVGSYMATRGGPEQAFLFSASQQRFLPIDIPNAVSSQALGVSEWSDRLVVCGWFKDGTGKVRGFTVQTDRTGNLGPVKPMDVAIPAATRTVLVGCDIDGQFALGRYESRNSEPQGFLAIGSGVESVQTIGHVRTLPHGGANAFRWIVGEYHPHGPYEAGAIRGFLYETEDYKTGHFSTIPSAAQEPDDMTESHAWDVNEKMTIVGELWLAGKRQGFIYRSDKLTTFEHPSGKDGTALFGINSAGRVVGATYADGVAQGFTAQAEHIRAPWWRVPERIRTAFGRRAPSEGQRV